MCYTLIKERMEKKKKKILEIKKEYQRVQMEQYIKSEMEQQLKLEKIQNDITKKSLRNTKLNTIEEENYFENEDLNENKELLFNFKNNDNTKFNYYDKNFKYYYTSAEKKELT
tara:strand:- start:766 stop:1104 length:339 start_codon:yes stop_codon:yes gene_type:complete